MEWTKKELRALYSETFGLDFSPEEMERVWEEAQGKARTPMGHGSNVLAVSPAYASVLITEALRRTGLTLDDDRFKKVREEIIPAIDFALLYKKLGLGEHLLISRENPDIALVRKLEPGEVLLKPPYRIKAVPIEIMNINDHTLVGVPGTTVIEQIANVIISRKFSKRYGEHTTLLVLLDIDSPPFGLDPRVLSERLCRETHGYHQVWLEVQVSAVPDCVEFVMLTPFLASHSLDKTTEVQQLMY